MKRVRLPFPVVILISATLFLVSSTLGEWIGGSSYSVRTPPSETVEQQQAAILYFRVMSWFSRVIGHPQARAEEGVAPVQPAELINSPTRGAATHSLETCSLAKSSHGSTSLRKSACHTLSHASQPERSRALTSDAGELGDSSAPASGS